MVTMHKISLHAYTHTHTNKSQLLVHSAKPALTRTEPNLDGKLSSQLVSYMGDKNPMTSLLLRVCISRKLGAEARVGHDNQLFQ